MSRNSRMLNASDFKSIGDENIKGYKVYVGKLNNYVTTQELYNAFKGFGEIYHAIAIPNDIKNKNKGFGFVTFSKKFEAQWAISDPPKIRGTWTLVNMATDKRNKSRKIYNNINNHHRNINKKYVNINIYKKSTNNNNINRQNNINSNSNSNGNSNDTRITCNDGNGTQHPNTSIDIKLNNWDERIIYYSGLKDDNIWNKVMMAYENTFKKVLNTHINSEIAIDLMVTRPLNLNLLRHKIFKK